MTKLDGPRCLTAVFYGNFLMVLLTNLKEAHVNERLKQNLTFHLVDSDRQLHSQTVFADNLDDLSFVLELFALVLDLSGGRKTRCNLWLHGVDDLKVRVLWFLKANPFGPIG